MTTKYFSVTFDENVSKVDESKIRIALNMEFDGFIEVKEEIVFKGVDEEDNKTNPKTSI